MQFSILIFVYVTKLHELLYPFCRPVAGSVYIEGQHIGA